MTSPMVSRAAAMLQFNRSLEAWPRNLSELQGMAQRVGQFLGAPLAAIYSELDCDRLDATPGSCDKIGAWASSLPRGVSRELLEEDLRRKIQALRGRTGNPPSRLELVQAGEVRSVLLVPIPDSLPHESDGGSNNGNSTWEVGWLIAGGDTELTPEVELAAAAIAQRLGELSEIERLNRAIQSRSQFLSIASHELKTPLTSIYGILQLQDRMTKLKTEQPPQKSYLKILLRQVERLNELIDGLLDVSRIQNGRFLIDPAETDIAQVLRETIQGRLSIVASDAGVKLHLEGPEHLLGWVDPVRFEEVVTNLVMNAVRFSPEGGVVWVRLREEGASIRLNVRDQGPNVPVEDRERIFQPFERAQRTSRLGGMGLGLFISRQIALLHGGNVSLVESVPGKGNAFEASFPLRAVRAVPA